MIDNKYRVQSKQWAKWSNPARAMFNLMYAKMGNQELFKHPDAVTVAPMYWNTTAWNASWLAADALMGVDSVAVRR